jgi:hypothetical protein
MFKFAQKVKTAISKSGWFANRSFDISEFKDIALNDSYFWSLAVDSFMREFGGLYITYERTSGDDVIHFDLKKAIDEIDRSWIEDYALKIKSKQLCVIGQAYSDHLTLIMDSNGKVYGGFDEELFFIGNSGEEAIEAICSDQKLGYVNP